MNIGAEACLMAGWHEDENGAGEYAYASVDAPSSESLRFAIGTRDEVGFDDAASTTIQTCCYDNTVDLRLIVGASSARLDWKLGGAWEVLLPETSLSATLEAGRVGLTVPAGRALFDDFSVQTSAEMAYPHQTDIASYPNQWFVTPDSPAGSSASWVYDSDLQTTVVALNSGSEDTPATFLAGDVYDDSVSTLSQPWNCALPVLDLWLKSPNQDDFTLTVLCTATDGSPFSIQYIPSSGADTWDSQTRVATIHLGADCKNGAWHNLHRYLPIEFQSLAPYLTFSHIGGLESASKSIRFSHPFLSSWPAGSSFFLNSDSVAHIIDEHNLEGSTVTYYDYDRLGNVADCSNESEPGGTGICWQDAFGNVLLGGWRGSYHQTTKEYDPIADQYYFNARWYSSEVALFTQVTSVRVDSEQQYQFCRQNPVGRIDPTGEFDWGPFGGECCNHTSKPEWALVAGGIWRRLRAGECTGFSTDCDGMTCDGVFEAVSNLEHGYCHSRCPYQDIAPGWNWVPGDPDDNKNSPGWRGAKTPVPPRPYRWRTRGVYDDPPGSWEIPRM